MGQIVFSRSDRYVENIWFNQVEKHKYESKKFNLRFIISLCTIMH